MDVVTTLIAALADRYAIEREIGRGGMATVYLARDPKHDRRVAIKVLDPELGALLGGARFLSEIKVTANLQHPNLLPLFDSGEAGGLLYYVMPFVEGESLRAKLDREKQLPVDEAVRIATAIANALHYAHSHGVVHRDLKPENVLLQAGQPIVADFGIALAVSNAGGARITQTGLSLGTPHYMSPEQATGDRTVDGRSDVYALGAMTYEMLVGEPPHTGSTAQAIISRVIVERPRPVRDSRSAVPDHVDAAVMRSLEKLPADRWATAAEFSEALQHASHTAGGYGRTSTTQRPRRLSFWGALGVAALAGAGAAAAVTWTLARGHGSAGTRPIRFELNLPNGVELSAGIGQGLVLTPDGGTLIYRTADSDHPLLFRRAMDEPKPEPIQGTAGALQPFGSPDGKWVGFAVRDSLWKVPIEGGVPALLAPSKGTMGASWGSNGVIVVGGNAESPGLSRISANGGKVVQITRLDSTRHEIAHRWPFVLPDGKTVFFTSWRGMPTAARIGMASLETGRDTVFDLQGTFVLGYIDGSLIFASPDADEYFNGAIKAVPIDVGRRRVTGEVTTLLSGVGMGPRGPAKAALSPAGTLVYQRGSLRRRLMMIDSSRRIAEISPGLEVGSTPRFSPDDKRIAFAVGLLKSDVWIYDVAGGAKLRLTSGPDNANRPSWSPDGKRVIYRAAAGKSVTLRWQPSDGSGTSQLLQGTAPPPTALLEALITPDGRDLVYATTGGTNGDDIWVRALSGDTTSKPIATSRFNEGAPTMSSDGRWIAYASDLSGASEIYVQAFPALGARYPVSLHGGLDPRWSADGRQIFYRVGRRLFAARVATSPTFKVIGQDSITGAEPFTFLGRNYDVARDGRLAMISMSDTSNSLMVVANWLPELRAKLTKH